MKRRLLSLVIVCFLIQGCANTPERYGRFNNIDWLVDVVPCDFSEINVSNFKDGWQTVRWDVYCDKQDRDFKCWRRGGLDTIHSGTVCVARDSHALALPAARPWLTFGSCVSNELATNFKSTEYKTFLEGAFIGLHAESVVEQVEETVYLYERQPDSKYASFARDVVEICNQPE